VCAGTPKKPGEFVNTWSVDGFISEGCQPVGGVLSPSKRAAVIPHPSRRKFRAKPTHIPAILPLVSPSYAGTIALAEASQCRPIGWLVAPNCRFSVMCPPSPVQALHVNLDRCTHETLTRALQRALALALALAPALALALAGTG
jgi:hypothetical protein